MTTKTGCTISLWLKTLSQPIIFENAQSYQKGYFICFYQIDKNEVSKFPVFDVFRIVEFYTSPTLLKEDK